MDPFHFSCPHCSSRLRVRDPMSLGRPVHCPECHQRLKITEGKTGLFAERVAGGESALAGANPTVQGANRPAGTARRRNVATHGEQNSAASSTEATEADQPGESAAGRVESGPHAAVSWWRRRSFRIVAATGCAGILIALASIDWTGNGPQSAAVPDEPAVAAESVDPKAAGPDREASDAAGPPVVAATGGPGGLERLGARLHDHLAMEKSFPAGTSPSASQLPVVARLSWQAILADRFAASHSHPIWDRPWNDPVNDAFVRRRLLEFQNPAITELTGADGYPATHFVGVAGVGEDAAKLDVRDPRAGIFAEDRTTRLEDVRDGLSNTWLVLGARAHLGSWAAGGPATVRPITRDPVVNGPDGIGTGQGDSMLVLLADGSVRTVSAAADPRWLRGMATINDGEPLRAGEHRSLPEAEAGNVASAADQADVEVSDDTNFDDLPLAPEFAPEPVRKSRDLASALRQPILLFDQSGERKLVELLPGIGEMAGAPIRIDAAELGSAAVRLTKPVQLRLENTTVGDILENLLKPAGLAYRIESDHLRIVPRQESD